MTEYAKLVVSVDSTQVGKAGTALGQLERSSKRTEQSIGSLGSTVRSIAAPLAAFLSVRAVIRASDEYGQMASRIRNATSSTEEYEMVQARLLETANGTYRALSEAQEVYLSTADTLRDLGYATSEVLDITDSFSYALVRDAARADQATSAMDAYSKALMKGKVDADAFATILAATPSIVNGISEATGRSTEEIRKLGATGKLSVEALNEGLRRSRDENKAFADAMETSVKDALVNLETQFGVFIGKVNETSGASGALVESIGELSDILADPATVEAAQQLAGGIVSAFNTIASGVKGTVEVVRWAAEEMAATFHGAASDDIVRLEDQLQTYQDMLANPLKRLRIGGDNQAIKLFDEEEIKANIAATQRQIDDFWRSQRNPPPVATPPNEGKPPTSGKSRGIISATGGAGEADKTTAAIERQISALRLQASTLGMTSDAVALYKLAQEGATETQLLQADAALRAVSAYEKQAEAVRLMEEQQEQTNLEASSILGSLMTEEEQIRESYQRRREIILSATLLTEQEKNQAIFALKQEHDELMLQANGSYWERYMAAAQENLASFDELAGTMLENFTGRFGDAFESMIFDSENLGDAVKNLGQGMARSIVNAIGQMIAQWLAYKAVQIATGKATQASAATTIAANATAMSITAGINAFASAAAIPIYGWAAAPGAMAAALAVTAPMAAAAGSAALAGMAHDGIDSIPNEGTWLLDKGERVVDRRTNADLKDFLSEGEGQGSGVIVNVNLVEDASKAGQVQKAQNADGSWTVTAFVADIFSDGPASKAISQKFGLSGVGR